MNKILILLLIVGYGVAGTEDYNYKCQKSHEHNKRRRVGLLFNAVLTGKACKFYFNSVEIDRIKNSTDSVGLCPVECNVRQQHIRAF